MRRNLEPEARGRRGYRPAPEASPEFGAGEEPAAEASGSMVRRGLVSGAAAAVAFLAFVITGIVFLLAGDGAGMTRGMLRFAPPSVTGLPEAEYAGVGSLIAGYLTGREAVFQYVWTGPRGESLAGFHDYEAAHMADCRDLIGLDAAVCAACFLAAAAIAAVHAVRLRRRGAGAAGWLPFLRGWRRGVYGLSVTAAVLVLWACVDFDSLFLLFHRVAFRNELWLLSPRTDLLIRLMPEELFVHLGLKGLLPAVGCGIVSAAVPGFLIRRIGRGGNHDLRRKRDGAGGGAAPSGEGTDSGAGNQLR